MIEINLFNNIESFSYSNSQHEQNIIDKLEEIQNIEYGIRDISLIISSMSSDGWLKILRNRTDNVMINYKYAMFYFNKGVSTKELNENNVGNFNSFNYFMENFFIGGFTLYENIARILDDIYFVDKVYENKEDDKRNIYEEIEKINKKIKENKKEVSAKIKHNKELLKHGKGSNETLALYEAKEIDIREEEKYMTKITDIIDSDDYKKIRGIRHDIVHNNPPLIQANTILKEKDENGDIVSKLNDFDPKQMKKYMDIFLEQYVEILSVLKEILEDDSFLKKI
ncbi:Cthe_2314 family HEPN domain-containing protein (plasmid) [Staphylococcus xylosus]|uniref:Cthe_2314 family HEPN domain-containing protein n=1 Tax=Staphylococcus xylosus TaxID=1288 RepID=UPI003748CF3E